MHQFRDKSVAQRAARLAPGCSSTRCSRPPTCSPTAPTRCRSARTSASTSSSCATSRGASTSASARSLVVPEHRIPEVGARVRDLQEPERKMSTTGGTEQGTVYVLDEPDAIRRKFSRAVTDSGTEIVRAPRQARHLEPDRDPRRGAGRRRPRRSSASSPAPGYGDFKAAVGDAVAEWLAPVRERYAELRGDEAALEEHARGRRGEGAGDRLRRRGRRPRRDGRRARARDPSAAAPSLPRRR